MRLVVCSDVHTDRVTYGVSRFDDIAAAVDQTVRVAIQEKADVWAMTGDWCDPDDGPAALRGVELLLRTVLALHKAGIESWVLAGNHCVVEDGSGRTVLSPLRALVDSHRCMVFEKPETFRFEERGVPHSAEYEGVTVAVLPYVAMSARDDDGLAKIKAMYDANPKRGLVLAHATHLPGIAAWEESKEMPRGRAVPFPFELTRPGWTLISGHYHEGQIYEATLTNGEIRTLTIPGALCRTTFGEEKSEPRFLILDL